MPGSSLPIPSTSGSNFPHQALQQLSTAARSQSGSTPEDDILSTQSVSVPRTAALRNRIRNMFYCATACFTPTATRTPSTSAAARTNPSTPSVPPPQPSSHSTLASQLRNSVQRSSHTNPHDMGNIHAHRLAGSHPRLPAVNGRSTSNPSASTSTPIQSLQSKKRAMLRYAAGGDITKMRILNELYPDVLHDSRDETGNTLLHLAAASPNVYAAVYCLMNLGGNIESRNDLEQTPLLKAAAHGRDETVEMLVDWGANILAHDLNHQSAFSLANRNCRQETYDLLQHRLAELM